MVTVAIDDRKHGTCSSRRWPAGAVLAGTANAALFASSCARFTTNGWRVARPGGRVPPGEGDPGSVGDCLFPGLCPYRQAAGGNRHRPAAAFALPVTRGSAPADNPAPSGSALATPPRVISPPPCSGTLFPTAGNRKRGAGRRRRIPGRSTALSRLVMVAWGCCAARSVTVPVSSASCHSAALCLRSCRPPGSHRNRCGLAFKASVASCLRTLSSRLISAVLLQTPSPSGPAISSSSRLRPPLSRSTRYSGR